MKVLKASLHHQGSVGLGDKIENNPFCFWATQAFLTLILLMCWFAHVLYRFMRFGKGIRGTCGK